MTKTEMHKAAMDILAKHNASKELVAQIDELLKPKAGGGTIDYEAIVKRDSKGAITHIQCQLSKMWLPATKECFFPANKENTPLVNANGDKLYHISRVAEKIRKQTIAAYNKAKAAITEDVLDSKISPADAKAKIAKLVKDVDWSNPKVQEAIKAECSPKTKK